MLQSHRSGARGLLHEHYGLLANLLTQTVTGEIHARRDSNPIVGPRSHDKSCHPGTAAADSAVRMRRPDRSWRATPAAHFGTILERTAMTPSKPRCPFQMIFEDEGNSHTHVV